MMATRLIPVRVGQVEVLVEAVVPPGPEQTAGALGKAGEKVVEAFDAAQGVMVELGVKVAGAVAQMGARAAHPDEVAVAFGLSFASNGSVIVAGASASASLTVTITYKRPEGTSLGGGS
jgi:Trypsin-co-occurring domain 1